MSVFYLLWYLSHGDVTVDLVLYGEFLEFLFLGDKTNLYFMSFIYFLGDCGILTGLVSKEANDLLDTIFCTFSFFVNDLSPFFLKILSTS